MDARTAKNLYLQQYSGGYRVIHALEPLLCVSRPTKDEAVSAAVRILHSYADWKTGHPTTVSAPAYTPYPQPAVRTEHFDPSEIVKVEVAA